MKKRMFLVCISAALAFIGWFVLIRKVDVSFQTIQPSIKRVTYDEDLNYIITQVKVIENQIPSQATLARDVVQECERMRILFGESFQSPVQSSIDFILQIHPSASGGPSPIGIDPNRSRELISRVILENKYDLVTIEGSGFDGFSTESRIKEIAARLKYEQGSPLYLGLVRAGVDPSSYEQSLPHLTKLISENDRGVGVWYELEKKTTASFLAGESIPLSTLVGRFIMREIDGAERRTFIERIQRVRSSYALAKTIKDLKQRSGNHGAIVFGFLHQNDFKKLASALGINSKLYNATGLSWQKLIDPW